MRDKYPILTVITSLALCLVVDITAEYKLFSGICSSTHGRVNYTSVGLFIEVLLCFLVCWGVNIFFLRKCSSRFLNEKAVTILQGTLQSITMLIVAINVFQEYMQGIYLHSNRVELIEYSVVLLILCLQSAFNFLVKERAEKVD